jgi:hypothetical protein
MYNASYGLCRRRQLARPNVCAGVPLGIEIGHNACPPFDHLDVNTRRWVVLNPERRRVPLTEWRCADLEERVHERWSEAAEEDDEDVVVEDPRWGVMSARSFLRMSVKR